MGIVAGVMFGNLVKGIIEDMANDPELSKKIEQYTSDYKNVSNRQSSSPSSKDTVGSGTVETPTAEQSMEQIKATHEQEDARVEDNSKDLEERLKKYKKTGGQWFTELAPSILGRVAETIGSAWNAKNSILANALLSISNAKMSDEARSTYGDPYRAASAALGGGRLMRGAQADIVGKAIGGFGEDLARKITSEHASLNATRTLLDPDAGATGPGNSYFDQQGRLYKGQFSGHHR